jgi:hypothetical protein
MSITYNLNIPFSTHNPSSDQPLMETNTNSIASIIAVDHVGFNVTGAGEVSGQHEQVTFNSNNVPAAFTYPILYTNNDASANPQLFFSTTSAANSTNQYVAAGNGSVLLLGGIIIKWGFAATFGVAIPFVSAFPHNCFVVQLTGTSSLYTGGFVVTAVTPSNFTSARTYGHSGATGYYYVAIGN